MVGPFVQSELLDLLQVLQREIAVEWLQEFKIFTLLKVATFPTSFVSFLTATFDNLAGEGWASSISTGVVALKTGQDLKDFAEFPIVSEFFDRLAFDLDVLIEFYLFQLIP